MASVARMHGLNFPSQSGRALFGAALLLRREGGGNEKEGSMVLALGSMYLRPFLAQMASPLRKGMATRSASSRLRRDGASMHARLHPEAMPRSGVQEACRASTNAPSVWESSGLIKRKAKMAKLKNVAWHDRPRMERLAAVMYPHLADEQAQREMAYYSRLEKKRSPIDGIADGAKLRGHGPSRRRS